MERRTAMKLMGATAAMAGAGLLPGRASAADKVTIALIPGLTADGFYVTMHKGAEAAAKAVGAELLYQGAAEWNVTLQVPILDAIIAKKPEAIMIAPIDKMQLIEPLRKAFDAGITVVCVDTFIGNGVFQTGSGDADFPIAMSRPTTSSAAAWRRGRWPRRSATRARSMSPTSSPAFRPPTSAKRASSWR